MESLTLNMLAEEFMANKAEQDRLRARNAEIAKQFEAAAAFEHGKSTAHLKDGDLDVTVTRKQNEKFDQAALNAARADIGDETFLKIFRWKWEPNKKDFEAFLSMGDQSKADMLRKAMTVTPGAPSIEIKRKEAK